MTIVGVFPNAPYVALERFLDLSPLAAIHDEICLALAQVSVDYTGGSHRSMAIMPASRTEEALTDYGEVIRALSETDYATFRSLADDPDSVPEQNPDDDDLAFGEERAHPLSRRQMLWLKFRHKVYFPWKAYVELMPNRYWTDKANADGKTFTRLARTFFPKTIAFAKSLPFTHIGRCNVMGLESNDHGTVHRDGDPADQKDGPDHFITICPAADKRLYLWDEDAKAKTPVTGRAYWFNDHDYHGVDADPFFRYSIRVDGVFRPDFLETLRREKLRVSDDELGGFSQKETIDKPGIIGARWWQESIANEVPRRRALKQLLTMGGALAVVAGAGYLISKRPKGGSTLSYDADDVSAQMKSALEMQKTYGWNFGATGDPLVFDGTTTKPFDPAALDTMATDFAPGNPVYTPFFVPTLFQSPTAMPTTKPAGDPDAAPFQPLKTVMRPVNTPTMAAAFDRGKALAAMIAGKSETKNTALVIDLPGPDAVAFAAGAAGTYDPVFLFDNWPHPHGVVASHLTLGAALYYQPLFSKARENSKSALPMFVLDRNRLATYVDSTAEFDNRYTAKLPPTAALDRLQINNVLYVGPTGLERFELDDLVDAFLDYKAANVQFRTCPAMAFSESHEAFASDTSIYYGGTPATNKTFWTDWGFKPATLSTADRVMIYTPTARKTAFSSGSSVPTSTRPRPTNFGYVPVVVAASTGIILGSKASRSGSWNRTSSYSGSSS